MRESLTYLAIGLILLLTGALVAPMFISWTDYRASIEAQLGSAVGAPVSTAGPITLRLLPTPTLTLGVLAAGDRAAGPWLRAEGLNLELALTPLLRGEIRISEAQLERPQLELVANEAGDIALPLPAEATDSVIRLDQLTVRDGSLTIRRASGATRFSGINFESQAQSLSGPFLARGEIAAKAGEGPQALARFSLSTGIIEKGQIRLKLSTDVVAQGFKADIDGALVVAPQGIGTGFSGSLALSGVGLGPLGDRIGAINDDLPWKITGALKVNPLGATLDALELRAGLEEKAVSAMGEARVSFGAAPSATVTLSARQLNLDRLGKLSSTGTPLENLDTLLQIVGDDRQMQPLPFALSLNLAADVATMAGETLTDTRLIFVQEGGRLAHVGMSANGPAKTRISLDGVLEPGIAAKFNGNVDLSTQDADRFEAWMNGERSNRTWHRPASLAGFKGLSVAGAVELSATGFAGRDLTLGIDGSILNGTVVYTRALGATREKLYANLTSEDLWLAALPPLADLPLTGPMDFSLSLTARDARLLREGESALELGRIAGKVTKTGDSLALEQVAFSNIGGASVSASGSAGPGGAHLDARLDASQTADLAELATKVAPGPWSDAFAARAPRLNSVRLSVKIDAAPLGTDTPSRVTSYSVDGLVGGTRLVAAVKPEGADALAISLALDAPATGLLLRQLGFEVPAGVGSGSGRINFAARKHGETVDDISLDANLAGTAVTYRGNATQGKAALKSANIAPLLQVLGAASPEQAKSGPASGAAADASADATVSPERVDIRNLAGTLAGSRFDGALAWRLGAAPNSVLPDDAPRVSGSFNIARASLATFASLSLGPQQPVKAGALWSDAPLGSGLGNPPRSEIGIAVGTLDLTNTLQGHDASFVLRMAPGRTSIEGLAVSAAGGRVGGRVDVQRDGAVAAVAGKLSLDGVQMTQGPVRGKLTATLDFASTGDSQLALAQGLAGSGELSLMSGQINGLDPVAFTRVLALAANDKLVLVDQSVASVLASELDRAAMPVNAARLPVTLAGGVARTNSVLLSQTPARVEGVATLDFRALGLELHATMTSAAAPKIWTGAPPQFAIDWKGPWPTAERRLDVSQLVNGLASVAIQRESERLATIDADIRERAFFNRRLKALEQERERERLRLLAEQEAARQALEEDRRKAMESARQQTDILRRQAPDATRIDLPRPEAPARAPGSAPAAPGPDASRHPQPGGADTVAPVEN